MKLPQSPRITIILLCLGALLIGIFVIWFGTIIFELISQSNDPVIASKVANQLVVFQQPLPSDWRYLGGENVFPMKSASLINDKAKTVITISEIANPAHLTAAQVDASLTTVDKRGKFEVAESGQTIVSSQPMHYRRGRLMDTTEGDVPMQRGVLLTPDGKAIIIEVAEIGAKSFDAKIAQPLLDDIKGFPRKQ